jgi:ATP-dependent RNA helicase SUPV3L1/SUV3
MVPLDVAEHPWSLSKLPPRTILIAFSRRDVLRLKYHLQHMGRSVAVVYGALPPEVRLKQAERFANEEVEICVATDAVGMGLNLPADHVVFSTLTKFDGKQQRRIETNELQQIGGRAGRYGFSERGYVGAIDRPLLDTIRRLISRPIPDIKVARLAPRIDEIELLEGDLAQRLMIWQELNAIPDDLKDILTSTDMADRIELSRLLSYEDLVKLGVESAVLLVSAPVRQESQEYWVECATAILRDQELPLPPPSPREISEGFSLKRAEMVMACIDIYLWLGYRRPFQHVVHDTQPVIQQRDALIRDMDIALLKKFNPNTTRFHPDDWYDQL